MVKADVCRAERVDVSGKKAVQLCAHTALLRFP